LSGRARVNGRRADALLLAATAIWGVSFVVVKAALAYATPLAFVSVRFALSTLVLAPGTAVSPRPTRGEIGGALLLTGLLAVAFGAQIVAVRELAVRYDARRLVWLQTAGTALAVGLAALLLESSRVRWTPVFVALLAYCAVFPTAVAFLWQMRAQRHMSSGRAALIFCFEPL